MVVGLAALIPQLLVVAHPTSAQGAAARPNVVVVMTDDQNTTDMRVMDKTRRKLAARGTTFTNYFSSFPLCCPSRATLLTGQYAHNHGVFSNKPPLGGYPSFDDRGTLGPTLQSAGYRTTWVGKYLNGYGKDGGSRVVPDGWRRWAAPVRGEHMMYRYALNRNGHLHRFGDRPADYQTDVYARLASRAIRRDAAGSRPFFTVLSMLAPHGEPRHRIQPVNPRPAPRDEGAFAHARLPSPPSFNERDISDKPRFLRPPRMDSARRSWIRARYRDRLASLLAADDAVDRVLRALRRSGELSNTYVIFASDNGFLLGQHRQVGKVELFEESIRVPLIIRGPGVPKGAERGQVAANIDLAPTILDLAGVAPVRPPDGVSLRPFIADPSYRADREILLENRNSQGVRTPGYKYIEHFTDRDAEPDSYELYDLGRDPLELENLIGPETTEPRSGSAAERQTVEGLVAELAAELDALRDCRAAGCDAP